MKKTISALLAVMMLAGVMSGCKDTPDDNGKETETTFESSQETEKEEEKKTVAKYTKMVETNSDGGQYTIEYEFDDKGNVIKEVETYSNGGQYTIEYEFDDKGNVIKEVETYSNGDQYVKEYEYDDKGNVVKKIKTLYNGNQEMTEYEYDDKGNLIREFCDGELSAEYEYDDKGNLIKEFCDGKLSVEYEYDENGNMTRRMEWGDDEGYPWLISGAEYTYDDNGNVIKEIGKEEDESSDYTIQYDYEYYEQSSAVKKKHSSTFYGWTNQYEYDENGKKTKKITLNFDGNQDITEYEYDENGFLVKEKEDTVFGREHHICEYEYKYDDKGNLIKDIEIYDGEQSVTEYEYDGKGNIIKKNKDGDEITEYEYDDKENKVKETRYCDNEIEEIIEWTLDEQGRMTKGKIIYPTDEEFSSYYYENVYDEKGNLINEKYPYYGGEWMEEYTYEYNEHGDVIKEVQGHIINSITEYDKDGKKTVMYSDGDKTEWEYDKNGNEIKETRTYSDGDQYITEWKYEYDDKGNLIKKTELENGEVYYTTEYFDYIYFEVEDDAA